MSATIHKLEADEFAILSTVEEGHVPDPLKSVAIIATDDAQVVGRMLLLSLAHIEGTWVKPDHRGTSILVRMMRKMEETAKSLGLTKMFSYAPNKEVEDYLKRLGYTKTELTVWSKEL
jgi:N-acetylglutamate synthase-like GNAT family acetyltransferase